MNFRSRLQNDELLLGSMLTLPSPEIAEMITGCGFDWLFMDGEHGPLSILDWQRQIQAVGGRAACVLRVPSASELDIKRALDIGADGIIVPMVNDADLARRVVAWSKYPPAGRRGVGLARAHGYGRDFAGDKIAVIVQAEHIDAVRNIDEIAAIDGLDAIFIGPYDLSASMGKTGQVDDDEVVAAIARVTETWQKHGLAGGFFGVDAASVQPYMKRGYRLICAGTDAGFASAGAAATLEALKA